LKLLRLLVGRRDDLDLGRYWWHRLLVVLFALSTAAVGLFVVAVARLDPPLQRENITVIARLGEYINSHPDLPNVVPSFEALGQIARELPSGELRPEYALSVRYFCSAHLKDHPEEVAAFLRPAQPGGVMDAAGATAWLEQHPGTCITSDASEGRIIAYGFTPAAIARSYALALAWSVGITALCVLIVLNLYNRAFLYVIFGRGSGASGAGSRLRGSPR